jgi:outer membrane immunogenic protein
MKTLVLATAMLALAATGAAQAADIPVKAPVLKAVAPVGYNWNGCHVGVVGGGAFGRSRHDGFPPGPTELTPYFNLSGAMIGGEWGCTYTFGTSWAFGTDSDFSWTNKRGGSFDTGPGGAPTFHSDTREHWFSTTRVRLGPTLDRFWFYGTGGLATASVEAILTIPGFAPFSETRTLWGWTAGAGFEYAFADKWSLKAEYLYARFQNRDYQFGFDPVVVRTNAARSGLNLDDHIFRIGLNYRFGCIILCADTVVARY